MTLCVAFLLRVLGVTLLSSSLLLLPAVTSAQGGATVVDRTSLTERLQEYTLDSPALGGTTTVRILEPAATVEGPHPVLYLLHGCCDDHTSWTREVDLEALDDTASMLIVMPDAGQGGWYTNWVRGPAWESFHTEELREWVERTYDVRADRRGRAIVGLSMGGFGAMSYAARHPSLYGFAAAFSGAVDLNQDPVGAGVEATSMLDGAAPGDVFGPRATDEIVWRGHNPWDLAINLAHTQLVLRTRDGTPTSDGGAPDGLEIYVHRQMVSLHERLRSLGIAHDWLDQGAGGHTWDLWAADLKATLPALTAFFVADPAPVTPPFVHRSIEDRFEVHGWEVERHDLATEFGVLRVETDRSFSYRGSGTARVTTPRAFVPGRHYVVRGADAYRPGSPQHVVADQQGRLAIELRISAANEIDEGGIDPLGDRRTTTLQVRIEEVSEDATAMDP